MWIDDPACSEPVGIIRWMRFRIGVWMESTGRRWYCRALDPDRKCEGCGENYWKRDHRACDEIPF